MTEDGSVLNELIKAKENIKRKFIALKNGEAEVQSLVSNTFKPIIEPLNRLHESKSYSPPSPVEKIESTNEYYYPFEHKSTENIEFWLDSNERDKIYGPKKLINGSINLGDKEIKFIENTIIIGDASYPLTSGLISLLFARIPTLYSEQDLKTYKSILIQTSAHLTQDGERIKKGGIKYTGIVKKLFPSGEGYNSIQLQKHNLVYWNDPNELVDRLRLLIASQGAGNTGVSNEILSIFEELKEAGIIKTIPNVC